MHAIFRWMPVMMVAAFGLPSAQSQPSDINRYVVTRWGMEEGLPQSSVNDILQTRNGYIWLATFGGLVRFDGVRFRTYDRFNTACIRSDRILRLYEDREGRLWASTEDGLLQFDTGGCRLHVFNAVYNSPSSMGIREDGHSRIWAIVDDRPYRLDGDSFVPSQILLDPESVRQAIADPNGAWMAYGNHLYRSHGDRIALVMDLSGHVDNNVVDAVDFPAGSGTVYIASSGSGIHRYREGVIEPVPYTEREHSRFIWRLHVDAQQRLWALNFYGLLLFDGTGFREYQPYGVPADVRISTVLDDSEGNLWIGSTNQGLFQLRPSMIRMIDQWQGLSNEQMLSLTRTRDGRYLFATNCGGVYEWKDGRARPSAVNRHLPNQCVWSVFQDSKGRYWFGSRELYMTTALEKPGVHMDVKFGFPFTDVNAITEDRSGNIWFGSQYGVVVDNGRGYRTFTKEDGLMDNDSRVFYQDRAGRMWVGSTEGVSRIEGDRVSQILLASDGSTEYEPYVRAIHEDGDGVMWFGTYGNGIYRLENGRVTNIRQEHGLFDNIVSHLIEDEDGHFWSGSNQGVFRTSRSMLNEFHRGRIRRVKSDHFGTRDGMNTAETNGGFQPSVLWDNGTLYFPTVNGVAVVDTREAYSDDIVPAVFITGIRTAQREFDDATDIRLQYDNTYLEIEYTGLYYRDAKKIRFRYRLTGLQEEWIEVGDRRVALFTKLPPGEYRFEVGASIDGMEWSVVNAGLNIVVVPPFWQTTWFLSVISVLFLVSGPAVYANRVGKLRKEQERQRRFTEQLIESQENERRRIAAELHDGLGQQILVIKNRAELAQRMMSAPEHATRQLDEIITSANSAIGDVRHITHGLRPVHLERFGLTEALTALCNDLQRSSKIEWSHHIDNIDDAIPADRQIHLYRIIQECATNIQKHAKAEQASVMVVRTDTSVKATIWDDGIGFDVGNSQFRNGLGMTGIRERIETLGGKVTVESTIGAGTEIRLEIPTRTQI